MPAGKGTYGKKLGRPPKKGKPKKNKKRPKPRTACTRRMY